MHERISRFNCHFHFFSLWLCSLYVIRTVQMSQLRQMYQIITAV